MFGHRIQPKLIKDCNTVGVDDVLSRLSSLAKRLDPYSWTYGKIWVLNSNKEPIALCQSERVVQRLQSLVDISIAALESTKPPRQVIADIAKTRIDDVRKICQQPLRWCATTYTGRSIVRTGGSNVVIYTSSFPISRYIVALSRLHAFCLRSSYKGEL